MYTSAADSGSDSSRITHRQKNQPTTNQASQVKQRRRYFQHLANLNPAKKEHKK
jgi:hypothetical protein